MRQVEKAKQHWQKRKPDHKKAELNICTGKQNLEAGQWNAYRLPENDNN
jgi:hypothetical protein